MKFIVVRASFHAGRRCACFVCNAIEADCGSPGLSFDCVLYSHVLSQMTPTQNPILLEAVRKTLLCPNLQLGSFFTSIGDLCVLSMHQHDSQLVCYGGHITDTTKNCTQKKVLSSYFCHPCAYGA